MKYKKTLYLFILAAAAPLFFLTSTALAGLAIAPGVTTDILDQIDQIQDETLREMLKTAIWPRFGETYLDLDKPEEELTQFEKNYKAHPLTWDQKIENVRYVLDQADNLAELTIEEVEYKDIVFGESVIPVPDRRVTAILNTNFLEAEIQKLAEEKQKAMAALYESDQDNIGDKLQKIEDEYATKLATLVQAENKYKEAKVEFLKLDSQKTHGRIDDETYQEGTREVVEDFESFFTIGSEVTLFDEEKIKQLGSSIYDETIKIQEDAPVQGGNNNQETVNEKAYYWTISVVIMLLAIFMGYLAFRRIESNKKKSNF